jgi:hypothetical protein
MITHRFLLNLSEDNRLKFGFYNPENRLPQWVNARIFLQKDKLQKGSWQIISSSLSISKFHEKYKLKVILRPQELSLSHALMRCVSKI